MDEDLNKLIRMVPAEVVSAAVAVGTDAGAESLDFVEQLFPGQPVQIFIHVEPSYQEPGRNSGHGARIAGLAPLWS